MKFLIWYKLCNFNIIIDTSGGYSNGILSKCGFKLRFIFLLYIAYNLLIDNAKTIDELNKIVNHYDNYIKEIYKEASPIEVMKKFKNIILDIDINNSEKLMYGFPIKKCLTK